MRWTQMVRTLSVGLAAFVASGSAQAALVGQSQAVGIAALKEWNVVTFNNLNAYSHIDGRVLVGGNLTGSGNNNFQITGSNGAQSATSSYGTPIITVAGSATVASNTHAGNMSGGIQVGGSLSGSFSNFQGGTQSNLNNTTNALTSQAADIKASLTTLSNNLKALANTKTSGGVNSVTNTGDYNNINLTTANAGLNVLNWTETDFEANYSSLKLTPANGATLVINVSGQNIDFNKNMSFQSSDSRVIWNFYEALTVGINSQFSGTILAVNADVTKGNNGNIDGTIAAKSLTQNGGEIHYLPFQGDLSSVGGSVSAMPEPTTWAMLILGFGLVGGIMRRQRGLGLVLARA